MTAHRTPLTELEQAMPFEQRHIGPDHEARAKMLAQVGYGSLDELTAAAVPDVIKNADALDLPLAGVLEDDPALPASAERGDPPGHLPRSSLARLCARLLAARELVPQ